MIHSNANPNWNKTRCVGKAPAAGGTPKQDFPSYELHVSVSAVGNANGSESVSGRVQMQE